MLTEQREHMEALEVWTWSLRGDVGGGGGETDARVSKAEARPGQRRRHASGEHRAASLVSVVF